MIKMELLEEIEDLYEETLRKYIMPALKLNPFISKARCIAFGDSLFKTASGKDILLKDTYGTLLSPQCRLSFFNRDKLTEIERLQYQMLFIEQTNKLIKNFLRENGAEIDSVNILFEGISFARVIANKDEIGLAYKVHVLKSEECLND